MSFATKLYYSIIGKKTEEQSEVEKIKFIKELLAMYSKQKIPESEPNDYAINIANSFFIDEVAVSKQNKVIMSSTRNSRDKIAKNTEVYDYVKSHYPEAKMMVIKDITGYNIIYPEGDMIYNIKSNGDISSVETRQIVRQLEKGLDKYSLK